MPESIAFLLLEKSVVVNADLFAVFAVTLKLNLTVDKSEECVIRTLAYIVAGVDVCSTLTNDDGAGVDKLSVASLCAESFGFGVTAVTG